MITTTTLLKHIYTRWLSWSFSYWRVIQQCIMWILLLVLFGCSEEEKNLGHFSPQVDYNLFGLPTSKEVDIFGKSLDSPSQQQIKVCSESHFSGEGRSSTCMKSLETTVESGDNTMLKLVSSSESSEATANSTAQQCGLVGNDREHKAENRLSVDDLSCAACKKLLFKPVVLNCGHGNLY